MQLISTWYDFAYDSKIPEIQRKLANKNSKATQVISNSGHDDMIHDAVLDYYGRKLATCSSDRTIKIFEIEGETQRLIETLKG